MSATSEEGDSEPPPLRWINGLAAPETAGFLGDVGRLLFGHAFASADRADGLAELHPWFRDFLGEEPAARLAQRIVGRAL